MMELKFEFVDVLVFKIWFTVYKMSLRLYWLSYNSLTSALYYDLL